MDAPNDAKVIAFGFLLPRPVLRERVGVRKRPCRSPAARKPSPRGKPSPGVPGGEQDASKIQNAIASREVALLRRPGCRLRCCRDELFVFHHLPKALVLLQLFVFGIFKNILGKIAGAEEERHAVVELQRCDDRAARGMVSARAGGF